MLLQRMIKLADAQLSMIMNTRTSKSHLYEGLALMTLDLAMLKSLAAQGLMELICQCCSRFCLSLEAAA